MYTWKFLAPANEMRPLNEFKLGWGGPLRTKKKNIYSTKHTTRAHIQRDKEFITAMLAVPEENLRVL